MKYGFKKSSNKQSTFVNFQVLLSDISDTQQNALLLYMLKQRGIAVNLDEEGIINFQQNFEDNSNEPADLYSKAGNMLFTKYLRDKVENEKTGKYQKGPVMEKVASVQPEDY